MEIKFCGTTSEFDVTIAKMVGADAIGVVCSSAPSQEATNESRTVGLQQADGLVRAAKDSRLQTVLLPRTAHFSDIRNMNEVIRPDRLQLAENTKNPKLVEELRRLDRCPQLAQVIHVHDDTRPESIDPFLDFVDIIHLDSPGAKPGGNGITHDWAVSREIADRAHEAGKQVFLAGGLTASDVAEAIEIVQPDGVDVESGIKGDDNCTSFRFAFDFVRAVGRLDN